MARRKIEIPFNIKGLEEQARHLDSMAASQGNLGTKFAELRTSLKGAIDFIKQNTNYTDSILAKIEARLEKVNVLFKEVSGVVGDTQSYEDLGKELNKVQGSMGGYTAKVKQLTDEFNKLKKAQKDIATEQIIKGSEVYRQIRGVSASDEEAIERVGKYSLDTPQLYEKGSQEREWVRSATKVMSAYKEEIRKTTDEQAAFEKKIANANKQLKEQVALFEQLNRQKEAGKFVVPGLADQMGDLSTVVESEAARAHDVRAALPTGGSAERAADEPAQGVVRRAARTLFTYQIVFNGLKRITKEAVKTIYEMDKAITEMTIATGMSRKEAYAYSDAIVSIAKATSTAMTDVARLTTEYLKQGRAMKDALSLAEMTSRVAKISSLSTSQALEYMTVAVNGFALAAKDAERVADTWALLGTASATDLADIAVGVSKVAAQANAAGMSLQYTSVLLTKMLETTQEAPESIGTALKTVIARMKELSDYGKVLEDDTSINQVERALAAVGVRLRETNLEFRSLEDVFTEVGMGWETYNEAQRQAIAQAMAGSRQQSRLLSIFQDYNRTIELTNIAQRSAGASMFQYVQYSKGMEAQITKLQNSWQTFTRALVETDAVITIIDTVATILGGVAELLKNMGSSVHVLLVLGIALLANAKLRAAMEAKALALKTAEVSIDKTGLITQFLLWVTGKKRLVTETAITATKWSAAAAAAVSLGIITIIAAVLAGIVFLVAQLIKNNKDAAYWAKQIEESQAKIYELEQKINETETKAKRYEELQKQVSKTNDELREMLELEKELQTEYKTGATLGVLLDLIRADLALKKEEARRAQAESMVSAEGQMRLRASAGGGFTTGVQATYIKQFQQEIEDALADIQETAGLSAEDFQKLTQAVQSYSLNYEDIAKKYGRSSSLVKAATKSATEEIVEYNLAILGATSDAERYEEFAKRFSKMSEEARYAMKGANELFAALALSPSSDKDIAAAIEKINKLGGSFTDFAALQQMFAEKGIGLEGLIDAILGGDDKNAIYSGLMRFIESQTLTSAERKSVKAAVDNALGLKGMLDTAADFTMQKSSYESLATIMGKITKGEALSEEDISKLASGGYLTADILESYGRGETSPLLEAIRGGLTRLDEELDTFFTDQLDLRENKIKDLERTQAGLSSGSKEYKAISDEIAAIENEKLEIMMLQQRTLAGTVALSDRQLEVTKLEALIADKNLSKQAKYEAAVADTTKAQKAWADTVDKVSKYGDELEIVGGKLLPKVNQLSESTAAIYEELSTEVTDSYETLQLGYDTITDYIVEQYKEETDNLKKSLDERKKLYDKYYNAITYKESQTDYDAQRTRLMNAIAKLSGATDNASLQRLKDYQKQLTEVEKEQAAEQRDLLKTGIDEQFETMQDNIEKSLELFENKTKDTWDAFVKNGIKAFAEIGKMFLEGIIPTFAAAIPQTVADITGDSATTTNYTSADVFNVTINVNGDGSKTDWNRVGRTFADEVDRSFRRRGTQGSARG